MKDKKLLYVVALVFIFFLSVGLTYAYFVTTVSGNGNDIKASVGTLSILYTDGPEIVAENIEPGWTTTKTVKVENTGTLKAFYSIDWLSFTNEITNDELVLSATCTSDTGTCDNIDSIPVTGDELVMGVGIDPGEEQTYVITFEFTEISSAQNYNQDKKFNGVLNVIESNETYTLMGLLVDSGGNPIEGANIEVHSTVRTGVTDENGEFTINGVEVGNHEIIFKNSSDVTIATDSIVLLSSTTESVVEKQITGNTDKGFLELKIKLDVSDINTISIIDWYEKCNGSSTDIKCKLLANNTEYADNVSSTYVTSGSGINFASISSDTNGKGLYYTVDQSKTEDGKRVYYFRGVVENNYLIFGGYCWRIVRTVEDGSLRLRYGGTPTGGSCPQTLTQVNIAGGQFNKSNNDNAYVGYMYGTAGSSSYEATHANTNESNIKKILDAWYNGSTTSANECYNLTTYAYYNCDFSSLTNKLKDYSSLIADTPYCNDRSIGTGGTVDGIVYTELGYGQNKTLYGPVRRYGTNGPTGTSAGPANGNPIYKCPQDNDKFTLKVSKGGTSGFGNNVLDYPIGLLTADEVVYAGLVHWSNNTQNYLRANSSYWLMSPYYYSTYSGIFDIRSADDIRTGLSNGNMPILPAISLKNNANVSSGSGTYNSPYVIE